MKRMISAAAAGLLMLTLVGCSSTGEQKTSAGEASVSTKGETTPAAKDDTTSTASTTTATVADGYPQEWIDLNIPKIDGLAVSGKYLPDYKQIRVVGDSVASDEVLTEFGAELKNFGWTERTAGEEYSMDAGDAMYSIMITTESGFTTFTVWEFEISK